MYKNLFSFGTLQIMCFVAVMVVYISNKIQYCNSYSVPSPRGRYGSHHILSMWLKKVIKLKHPRLSLCQNYNNFLTNTTSGRTINYVINMC